MAFIRKGDAYRWWGAVVPVTYDPPTLRGSERIQGAIAHFHANTTVRFVDRTIEADYMTVRYNDDFDTRYECSSDLGHIGGQQFLNTGPYCNELTLIHELGHTIGLRHEQNRHDRDRYVVMHEHRIEPGREGEFQQPRKQDATNFGRYDFASIMHYQAELFSIGALYEWDKDLEAACFYTLGRLVYLATFARNGAVRVYPMEGRGQIGPVVSDVRWSAGIRLVAPVRAGRRKFLFAFDPARRLARIHRVNPGGTIGPWTVLRCEAEMWTSAVCYRSRQGACLALLARDTGFLVIRRVNGNGTLGAVIHQDGPGAAWTEIHAVAFEDGDFIALFDGARNELVLYRPRADGAPGDEVGRVGAPPRHRSAARVPCLRSPARAGGEPDHAGRRNLYHHARRRG